MASPAIKLNNGHSMPQVGFGLWKVENATCANTVYNAIKTGYRLFDGACGTLPSRLDSKIVFYHEIWHNITLDSSSSEFLIPAELTS